MSVEANKAIVRRSVDESFNTRDLNVLDELVDINFIDHAPFPGQPPGLVGMKQAHTTFYAGFPDIHQTIDDIVAEGDKVVVRWTCCGTHAGRFIGIPPTGKQVTITGIDIFQLEGGKITECWHNVSEMSVAQQLGIFSPSVIGIIGRWLFGELRRLLTARTTGRQLDSKPMRDHA